MRRLVSIIPGLLLGACFPTMQTPTLSWDFMAWVAPSYAHGVFTWIASGGPAGDDPCITCSQQPGQLPLTLSAGVQSHSPGLPSVEIGTLRFLAFFARHR
jgi:hypothetical protein